MQAATNNDILFQLRGEGVRAWRRMTPTAAHPATASLKGRSGALAARPVVDVSMGGIGLQLRRWDQRKLRTGESVHIELDLGGRPLLLQGRIVHIQVRNSGWLRSEVTVGVVFENNLSLSQARPKLASYLMQLVRTDGCAES